MIAWLVAFVVFAAVTKEHGWSEGQGPFDQFPNDTADKPLSADAVKASSGRTYTVYAYKRNKAGPNGESLLLQTYYVAKRTDTDDWVSYLYNPSTQTRFLFRASAATVEGLDDLKKDFGL